MTAVWKRHPEDRFARLERCEEYRLVRLRAGVRLHIGGLGAEELFHAVDGERLSDVDILAATVVALAGIAFRVLVGELRPLRLQYRGARVVLRCDQLEMLFLAKILRRDRLGEFRVDLSEGLRTGEHDRRRGQKVAVYHLHSLRRRRCCSAST